MHPRTVAVPALTALLLVGSWTSATAGGSDGEPPYAVTPTALVLPAGDALDAHDHVNVAYDLGRRTGSANLHVEPGTGTGRFVGRGSVTWQEVGVPAGACITWVQVSGYDEHYGEGHQRPVCTTGPTPSPTPTDEASPTPSPRPSRTPDCPPSATPTPTATPYLPPPPREPTPEPSPSTSPSTTPTPPSGESDPEPTPTGTPTGNPTDNPTDDPSDNPSGTPTAPVPVDDETASPTPTATPEPSPSDDVQVLGPTPSPTSSVDSEVLADGPDDTSGDDTLATTGGSPASGLALGIAALALGAGFVAMRARTRHRPAHRRDA